MRCERQGLSALQRAAEGHEKKTGVNRESKTRVTQQQAGAWQRAGRIPRSTPPAAETAQCRDGEAPEYSTHHSTSDNGANELGSAMKGVKSRVVKVSLRNGAVMEATVPAGAPAPMNTLSLMMTLEAFMNGPRLVSTTTVVLLAAKTNAHVSLSRSGLARAALSPTKHVARDDDVGDGGRSFFPGAVGGEYHRGVVDENGAFHGEAFWVAVSHQDQRRKKNGE